MTLLLLLLLVLAEANNTQRREDYRIAESVGYLANITEVPFVVALCIWSKVGKNTRLVPFCTGSIIHKNWILTAAHCIDKPVEDLNKTHVVAGSAELKDFWDKDNVKPYVQIRQAKEGIHHPEAWTRVLRVTRFDVGLLKVDDFTFSDRIKKAELRAAPWAPPAPQSDLEFGIMKCDAYGWGSIKARSGPGFNKPTFYLLTTEVTAHHGQKACPFHQMFQNRRGVCCVHRALCPGDSGGPLVFNNTVLGVAHLIIGLKEFEGWACDSDYIMSVWSYVCPLLDFIHKHVPTVPPTPESCSTTKLLSNSVVTAIGLWSVVGIFLSR